MATPETALLADFDFDLTSNANATPLVPRPPTPDPRRTPTPHPPRRSKPPPPPSTDAASKRLRKKPTAIFVGSEPKSEEIAYKPRQVEAQPFFDFSRPSHHTIPSLLPLLPSTPSPRFASSPSLSSSATTVQSSPTLTPTTPHFASSHSEPQAGTKGSEGFNTWNYNKGTFGLRRAKRLPHREQGLWEVHAVVHISEDGRDGGSSSGIGQGQGQGKGQNQEQPSQKHYEWCIKQQRHAGFLATSLPPESVATNNATTERSSARNKPSVIQNNATPRDSKLESFHGIHLESTRREGGLRKTQTGVSSNFSLSKYQFPAPPGDYRVGLSGECSCGFLATPFADISPQVTYNILREYTTEVRVFPVCTVYPKALTDYRRFFRPCEPARLADSEFTEFRDTCRVRRTLRQLLRGITRHVCLPLISTRRNHAKRVNRPRAFYTDAETARRDIMRLGDFDEVAQAATSSNESSAASLVPPRVRSDPFDLRLTDVPSQATYVSARPPFPRLMNTLTKCFSSQANRA